MKRGYNILMTLFFLAIQSCNTDETIGSCQEMVCTLDFRTVVVQIEDSEGDPIALDSFKVMDLENQIDITSEVSESEFEMMQENGTYPIFGDQFREEYQNKEIRIQFIGSIGQEEIVTSIYKVGADCCHVYYISGTKILVIE